MNTDLDPLFKRLHLANARRVWRDLVQRAEKEEWSYEQLLHTLVAEEIAHRRGTRLSRAVRAAAFPFLRTIEEFDFSYQSTLRLTTIGSLLAPDFVTEGRSVNPASSAPTKTASAGVLPSEDKGFIDTRGGWGWSDRCWKNIGANRLDAARAECAEGLKMTRGGAGARPSLLYNLGLVEERSGNPSGARALYEESLSLRPNDEVAAALSRVGGSPPTKPVQKSIRCGATTCSKVCCATFKEHCANDASECDRATNGEGTILLCGGPDDCESGQVCCRIYTDRTTAQECIAPSKCRGVYHHPRYGTDLPLTIVQ